MKHAVIGYKTKDYFIQRYDAEWSTSGTGFDPAFGTWAGNTAYGSSSQTPNTVFSAQFNLIVPSKNGDIYIMLDTYPHAIVPSTCRSGSYKDRSDATQTAQYPVVYFGVFKDNQVTSSTDFTTATVPDFGFKYY